MGKNIFATIKYVVEKIEEVIIGHNSNINAHPSLVEQLNDLSTGKLDKMKLFRNINLDTFYNEGVNRVFNVVGHLPKSIQQGANDLIVTCYPLEEGHTFIRKTLLDIRNNKMYLYSKVSESSCIWEKVSTTSEAYVQPNTGWTTGGQCGCSYVITGNLLTFNALLQGNGTNTGPARLPAPKDGNYYAGQAIAANGNPKYIVVKPDGWLEFQAGYEPNILYAITVSYPIREVA